MVKAGDSIPSVELAIGAPDKKVNLSHELASGKGLIIGVPAAFSPTCSDAHVPGYLTSSKTKNAGKVYVVSVNDAFVMNAWGKQLDPDKSSGISFASDATGSFSKALDLYFDATPFLGGIRSKRYAITTEDGKVKSVHVEQDPTKVEETGVDSVLG
ncbi:MAG: hypothetical protein LQ340_007958 [Diploschistes diacapsis]|nr:MAG: hypothetical protein LQ340_007958 [Diploschistes diacapsis]